MALAFRSLVVAIVAVSLLFCLHTPSPSQEKERPSAPRQKWNYKLLDRGVGTKLKDVETEFNQLGEEGWELITTYQPGDPGVHRFVFKRAKQ